jgi:hypothetical protein
MSKNFFRRTKTKKEVQNILLDNFALTMSSCHTDFQNGVVLHCKRGKNFSIIEQSSQGANLSKNNLRIEFAGHFCHSPSAFFRILDNGDGPAYQEKKLKINIIGSDSNGRKRALGEI